MPNYVEFTDEDRLEPEEGTEPVEDELEPGEEGSDINDEDVLDDGSEGTEGDDEDPLIPIQYSDDLGNIVTDEIPYSTLGRIVKASKSGVVVDPQVLEQSKALWGMYNDSNIIKQVIAYRAQGFDEQQIMKGMAQLYQQAQQMDAGKQFENVNDEIQHNIEEQVKHHLTPLKQKLADTEAEMETQRVLTNNEKVFTAALKKRGIDPEKLTDAEITELNRSRLTAYPNTTLGQFPLSQAQAHMIVNDAFRNRKGGKQQQGKASGEVRNVLRQAQAPAIIPSKPSRDTGSRLAARIDGISMTDRAKNFRNIFG